MNWRKYLKNAFDSIAKKKQDNFLLDKNKTLKTIEKYIHLKQYEYSQWRPFFQKKKEGGLRPIISPPIKDRILLKALSNYCSFKLKLPFTKVDDVSFAYQKGKGTRDALIKIKSLFKPGNVIVKIDIQKFFNNINKEILINLLEKLNLDEYAKSLIKKSLSPTLVHNEAYDLALESIQNGIPQGNAVSDVLSNLYLLEFDETCKNKNLRLIRYADDMVIIVDNEREVCEVLKFVEDYLSKERGLSIHPLSEEGKTAIYLLPQRPSLTYLGVEFDGSRLLPSIKCYSILSNKINSIAKNINTTTGERIKEIETCINQWCGYYAFTDAPTSRLKKLSSIINHNCQKFLKEQWRDVDIEQKFIHYKKRQSRKLINILNNKQKNYGEEYNWLICY